MLGLSQSPASPPHRVVTYDPQTENLWLDREYHTREAFARAREMMPQSINPGQAFQYWNRSSRAISAHGDVVAARRESLPSWGGVYHNDLHRCQVVVTERISGKARILFDRRPQKHWKGLWICPLGRPRWLPGDAQLLVEEYAVFTSIWHELVVELFDTIGISFGPVRTAWIWDRPTGRMTALKARSELQWLDPHLEGRMVTASESDQ